LRPLTILSRVGQRDSLIQKHDSIMKILFISPGSSEIPPGRLSAGIQEIDYHVAKQLSLRFKVTIVSPFYSHYERESYDGSLKISYVFYPAIRADSKATPIRLLLGSMASLCYSLLALFEVLKEKESQVLIFSEKNIGVMPALFARLLRKRVIFSEGNPYPWYWSKFFRPSPLSKGANLFFGRLACNLSNVIRAQSTSIEAGMIRSGIDHRKIVIIPGGVDTDLFKPVNNLPEKSHEFTVGFVGRLTDEKGAPLLYEIAKRNQSRFLVVGRGIYENKLSSLTNVMVVSNVSRTELARLINTCDIFVAPHPDASLTVLEEMACGKPVIALESKDMRNVITHMKSGLICRADSEEFCKTIEDLRENSPLRERLGVNAREVAIELSWQKIGERWLSLLYFDAG
jgi:glycosyltransferase involved in cell wall biosynthesis